MSERSLDELRDLAAGYVMQTLTPEEQRDFARAMDDPALAAVLAPELEAHRAAVEWLATSQPVAPPPALRGRLQARIGEEARAAPVAPRESLPSPPTLTVVRGAGDRPARALPIGLALAFAASALFALRLQRDVGALRRTVQEQTSALAETREQLARRDATLRTLTDAGSSLLLVRLSPDASAGPSLQLFWNVKQGKAVIYAAGLAPLSASRTYQLWMIRDGKPVSVALFRPDSSGAQLLGDLTVPTATAGVAAFAVTEEPAAGSAQPTMTPFLVGAVSATP